MSAHLYRIVGLAPGPDLILVIHEGLLAQVAGLAAAVERRIDARDRAMWLALVLRDIDGRGDTPVVPIDDDRPLVAHMLGEVAVVHGLLRVESKRVGTFIMGNASVPAADDDDATACITAAVVFAPFEHEEVLSGRRCAIVDGGLIDGAAWLAGEVRS